MVLLCLPVSLTLRSGLSLGAERGQTAPARESTLEAAAVSPLSLPVGVTAHVCGNRRLLSI